MKYLFLAAALVFMATSAPAQSLQPTEVSPADADGPVFERPGAEKRETGSRSSKDFIMLESSDKAFSAGIFESSGGSFDTDGYAHDEFMYFIKGGVRLTSEDGSVTEIGPGDAVTIPKGWKGRWESDGYTKYYVIYEPSEQ